jgi:hypothetical protein
MRQNMAKIMFKNLQRPSTVDTKAQMMEREEIIHYFEALIDLIRKARISQKSNWEYFFE